MSKVAFTALWCILSLGALAADLKVATRHMLGPYGPPSTQIQYFKGQRQRTEIHHKDFSAVTIYQCDLHRVISLDEKAKTYRVYELDEHGLPKTRAALDAMPASRLTRSGNKVTVLEDVVDTGERKDFSGVEAKHLVKTTRMEPQQTSCSSYGEPQRVDGWYIEGPALGCSSQPAGRVFFSLVAGGPNHCVDSLEFKHSGPQQTGIVVQQTTTSKSDGREFTDKVEPVEVSQQSLDPKLFEIPPDYKEYSAISEAARYYWLAVKQALANVFR